MRLNDENHKCRKCNKSKTDLCGNCNRCIEIGGTFEDGGFESVGVDGCEDEEL